MTEPGQEIARVEDTAGVVDHYDPRAAMLQRETDSWVAVVREVSKLAGQICATELVPAPLRPRAGERFDDGSIDYGPAAARVTAVMLHGRELGLPPMTALAMTHVIEGRTGISAEAMRALVIQAGHSIEFVESTTARCVMRGRRMRDEKWTTVEWTIADAQRAGLTNKSNWKGHPRRMLQARATSELCQMIFADVIHGMRALEELDDDLDSIEAPAVGAAPGPKAGATVRRTRKTPPAPAAAEAPQEPPTERRRAALPARESQPASEPPTSTEAVDPGPGQGPTPAEDAGEAQAGSGKEDAADFPAAAPEAGGDEATEQSPPAASEEPKMATRGQVGSIVQHFQRLGVTDRDQRLTYTMTLTERDQLGSTSELTWPEARKLLIRLQQLRDAAALDEALSAT